MATALILIFCFVIVVIGGNFVSGIFDSPDYLLIAVGVCLVLYIIYRILCHIFFSPYDNTQSFIYNEWSDIVVNDELETEIEDYAKMPWHSEGDERLPLTANEIDDDAYSADEKKLIAEENRKEFKRILMAVHGHLPREDVEKGVVFHERQESNKDFRTLPSQMPTPVNNAKFMLWLKEELKSHSMDAPLYVEQAGKIYLAEDFPEMTGKFIWGWTSKDITRKCKSCGEITSKFKCPACGQWNGQENYRTPKEASKINLIPLLKKIALSIIWAFLILLALLPFSGI